MLAQKLTNNTWENIKILELVLRIKKLPLRNKINSLERENKSKEEILKAQKMYDLRDFNRGHFK